MARAIRCKPIPAYEVLDELNDPKFAYIPRVVASKRAG